MGARRKSQPLNRGFQQLFALRRNRADACGSASAASARWRRVFFSPRYRLELSVSRAHHALANRRRAFNLARRRAVPCISPRALRCEYRCGRAAAPKSSTRSAESAAACSGIRRVGSPKNPHGHGFMAAASMNRDGKVTESAAREIVTRHLPAAGASLPARCAETPAVHPETARRCAPAKLRPAAAPHRRRSVRRR